MCEREGEHKNRECKDGSQGMESVRGVDRHGKTLLRTVGRC
jgi:hypothetical protein